jgi:hypothetical protein
MIKKASFIPREKAIYTGVRKIVCGFSHQVTELPQVDLEMLGYRGGKIRQLLRNYHNEGEIQSAKVKLKARRASEHTSVAVSTLGSAKDSRSQGFCLRNIIITQTPKQTEVDVVWRSTEFIQKNTADYALLPLILEQLDLAHRPLTYRFYMANGFVTALFMPLLFVHTDPVEYFEELKLADSKYYRTALNAFAKFTEPTCRYNYKHRQKMYHFTHKYLDVPKLKDYCLANGASFKPDSGLEEEDV